MRSNLGVVVFISIMLLMDLYVFTAVKSVSFHSSSKTKSVIFFTYWTISIFSVIGVLMFAYTDPWWLGKKIRTYLLASIVGLFLAKLLILFFLFLDDLRRGIQWLLNKIYVDKETIVSSTDDHIPRSIFLSWLGLSAGMGLFGSLLNGFRNKYEYKVIHHALTFSHLPDSFRGLKMVHISDIHCGSFLDKAAVSRGVELIMKQNADLILFTGDLVNDRAIEMDDYKELFSTLRAPMGVYSTLGNHDYGEYVKWPIQGVTKEQNLEQLKKVHADMGWKLLLNEHVILEKEHQQIALIGIENWSAKARFPKYGKLDQAYQGTEHLPFKILMSHDPSHWHAEVRKDYTDIDLTLSGHTHGMQFGVELPGFKWSPIQYMYKEWAGLYEDQGAKLNVNRGFGFIGYPGRVGVMPEITVIELV